jgi:PLP dependent protein
MMTSRMTEQLTENLRRVRERIAAACARSARPVDAVTMVAVTKYAELEWVRALIELGITDLGESRPQQLAARANELPPHVRWHLIGHLQRNKIDLILPVANRLHSADSTRLLQALNDRGRTRGLRPRVLIEVNVANEASKDGFAVDELLTAWPGIQQFDSLAVDGLMTMAPQSENPESARRVFRALRELRDRLRDSSAGRYPLPELSMGMSGDFEIGIEEGATLIRIGSSLFEGLAAT